VGFFGRGESHTPFRASVAVQKAASFRRASVLVPNPKVEKGARHAYFLSCAERAP
jgi:hypothetical protein